MNCPHCGTTIGANWRSGEIHVDREDDDIGWGWRTAVCPGTDCGGFIIRVGTFQHEYDGAGRRNPEPMWVDGQDYVVWPRSMQRIPLGEGVPQSVKDDYREACAVLSVSTKASAALSRRILEAILTEQGFEQDTLHLKIEDGLSQGNLPDQVRDSLHTLRKFGNFSAHPPANHSAAQIVDVEDEEADWCLGVIERLINHYYVHRSTATQDQAMAERAEELRQARKPSSPN